MLELKLGFGLVAVSYLSFWSLVESICTRGCDLALGSYYVEAGNNLTSISKYINTDINTILKYNPNIINQDNIRAFVRINVPFSCDCINGDFLAHVFSYNTKFSDSYELIAERRYANLTTAAWIQRVNWYDPDEIPDNTPLNVAVNCSCGDSSISKAYGLFVTYPLRSGETLESVSLAANLSPDLIRSYNPDANFSAENTLIYIPGRDKNGNYPPLRTSSGLSGGAIGGVTVAGVLLLAGCVFYGFYRKKKSEESLALLRNTQVQLMRSAQAPGASPGLTGIVIDRSVEFSYEELSRATDEFSLANKIGQGGSGAVYYAELRGEKVAIKKMDMQASTQFLAELKVLTHVHHLNLVRLIGYCVEGSLFLVYEYLENGNLRQLLHGTGRDPLPWSTRVQIALDSAMGLKHIHEHTIPFYIHRDVKSENMHTIPFYIHRDVKSENILIDKNFCGKVADFGLTKLIEVGSTSLHTNPGGTFGYMPPEYTYGEVSTKTDVYAFGVVLYELISAKEAVVKANSSSAEPMGLVSLFDKFMDKPNPKDDLVKMIDPRLEDNYPLDSVHKMARLARFCTHKNPQLRPSMRSIVVTLMALLSSMEDSD